MGPAETATYFNAPTVLTTSLEDGPNGPMLFELKAMFPNAPYIPHPGQINAWNDPDFVNSVEEWLLLLVTDGCVTFVALSVKKTGYEVFVVIDACVTFNEPIRDALMRMQQRSVQLMHWFAAACE